MKQKEQTPTFKKKKNTAKKHRAKSAVKQLFKLGTDVRSELILEVKVGAA